MKPTRSLSILIIIFTLDNLACSRSSQSTQTNTPIQILLDQAPSTLNPRQAIDVSGQRLTALLFRALTRRDENLTAQPDLAKNWNASKDGHSWRFEITPDLKDHEGDPITPEKIRTCLENYRIGKPTSPHLSSYPFWTGTSNDSHSVTLELSKSDPYLPKNITLLRYFRVKNNPTPCPSALQDKIEFIGNGFYKMSPWDTSPETDFDLVGAAPLGENLFSLKIRVIRDDSTRLLKLLKGELDLVSNSVTLTKTKWMQREHSDRFTIFERDGVNVSYIGFNLRDPILKQKEVRQAIAHALPREEITQHKMLNMTQVAGSLLSPELPESMQIPFEYNPQKSIALLEKAGFHANSEGIRLHLRQRTTSSREGIEAAMLFQEYLKKIGIDLILDVVEPSTFLHAIKAGRYQIYSSRWVGVADASILYSTLRTGEKNNRVKYSNPVVDQWLDQAAGELDTAKRIALYKKIQTKMMDDLPYFPLWFWNNSIIVKKELAPYFSSKQLSLSGGLEPLLLLHK